MNRETLMLEITKPEHRHDPYPLYAEARRLGVTRQHDGAYLVAGHREVAALLHDPRVSSDQRNRADPVPLPPVVPFIGQDAPNHDRLRRIAMNQFGPPDHAGLVASKEPDIAARFDELLDSLADRTRIDVVDDLAYPLPVAVICELLGVPPEDEETFRTMANDLVRTAGAQDQANADELVELRATVGAQMGAYLLALIGRHRANPADNLLSRLANDTSADRMEDLDLIGTGALMLVAGHETTVNLIANGTLTMLRHPHLRDRLREEPEIALRFVEELLRFEPPVQYLPNRVARTDIEVAGTTIPKGSRIILLLAAASRDPDLFANPDEFDPDRRDNLHYGLAAASTTASVPRWRVSRGSLR
jgi:cytochrome P450